MGKFLAQRRTETDLYPGWLDATAGGVVQQGENALKVHVVKQKKS